MNFCVKCGGKMNETGNICTNCGIKYEIANPSSTNVVRTKVKAKTNGLAIAGMITGLISLGFSMWGLLSILAIVFSSVSRKQIEEYGEKGDGMAVTGLCCGIVSLIMLVLFWTMQGCIA